MLSKEMNAEKTIVMIRRAELNDAAAVAALLLDAFAEYRPLYTEKGFDATTPAANEIGKRIEQRAVWLAEHDNKIAGTVSIFPRGEELYIRSMAVSQVARGKGIGKILM